MRAWVVQHVPFEGPAMIAEALRQAGAQVRVVRSDLGEDPPSAGEVNALVLRVASDFAVTG